MAPARTGRRGRLRWVAVLVLALAASVLAACEPATPDGRDLGLTIGAAPSRLGVGATSTFPVEVVNHGSAAASGVSVALIVAEELEVEGEVWGEACIPAGAAAGLQILTCRVGSIPVGWDVQVSVTLTGAAVTDEALFHAQVASDGPEPVDDPHPGSARTTISVEQLDPVDLHVTAHRDPASSMVDEPFESSTTVVNRGSAAATDVVVSQSFPDDVSVRGFDFRRADGGASGDCTVAAGSISCTTGAAAVDPFVTLDDGWTLAVILVPGSGSFFHTHRASSPHPEPEPDRWPNAVTVTQHPERERLLVDPVGVVPIGAEFDVGFRFDPTGIGAGVAQYLSISSPPGVEPISLTVGGTVYPCTSTCGVISYFSGGVVRFRATELTDQVTVGLYANWEAGGGAGSFTVQVVDPEITSDLHPDIEVIDRAVLGERSVLKGVVRNPGSVDHGAVVVDVVGPDVDAVMWGGSLLPCTAEPTGFRCHVGDLPGPGTQPLRVELVPGSTGPSAVTVTVSSTTAQDDPDPFADSQVIDYLVDPSYVDLGVTLSARPEPVTAGVPATLVATVTNHGTVAAPDARLDVDVPAGFPVTGTTSPTYPRPPGWQACETAGQQVGCELGDLAPGASIVVEITTSAPTADAGTFEAAVTSGATEPSPDPHPGTAVLTVTVAAPSADMRLQLFTVREPLVADELVELELRVDNRGPSESTATVEVDLPTGWTVDSATVRFDGTCTVSGSRVTCAVDDIGGVGGYDDIYIDAVPDAAGTGLPFSATLTSPLPDPGTRPDSVSRTFDVLAREVDLSLTATEHPEPVAGLSQAYSVRLRDLGPASLPEGTLTATFPDGVRVDRITQSHSGMPCVVEGQAVTCTGMVFDSDRVFSFWLTHLVPGVPVEYQFSVTSPVPEVADEVGANQLTVTRTPAAGDARLRVWVYDDLGNRISATVGVYRPNDLGSPGYTATGGQFSWYEVSALPPGEYRVLVTSPGHRSEWWDGALDRTSATPLVAAGLSERWDLDVVLERTP